MDSRPDAGPPRNRTRRSIDALRRIGVAGLRWPRCFGGCGHAPGYPPNPIAAPHRGDAISPTLYSENCAACHGANGQNGPAIDLANPEYQALVDDATLRKWISGGMPGTEMPAFAQSAGGMLTDAQVNALIAGMRKQWSQSECLWLDARHRLTHKRKTGDPHRGEQGYQARCAACHDGISTNRSPARITLSLVGDQALRSIIIAGRPDIGQPDWQHDGPGGKADRAAFGAGSGRHCDVSGEPAEHSASTQAANTTPKQPAPAAPRQRGEKHEQRKQTPQTCHRATRAPSRRASHARRSPHRLAPLAAVQSRHRAQRPRRPCARRSRVPLSARALEERRELRLLGLARPAGRISRRRNAPRVLQESIRRIHGTARPTTSPATCAARAAISSRSSPSTARTSAARCAGFRSRSFSCVPATAASTTLTVRAPPVRPSAASSPTTGKSPPANCRSTPAKCLRSRTPRSSSRFPPDQGDCSCSG